MNVGICGICGRVGREILSVAVGRGHDLAAAFDTPASPGYGKTAGSLIQRDDIVTMVGDLSPESVARCGCIIDFSAPAATMTLLEYAADNNAALVIGTTGLSDSQKQAVERASSRIPIILSPNMAIGVNVLFKLTEIASSVLSAGFDVEIFEAHHRHKKDAPSGTAARLLEIVRRHRKDLAEAREVSGRKGMVGERADDEIGVFAMRAGDIVGEHTVFFAGRGERIELTHRAMSRNNFAAGAVLAMEFLNGRQAGMYTMFDVLGLA